MKVNKKLIFIISAILVVLVAIGLLVRSRSQSKVSDDSSLLEENVIPTVDSSVKVSLKSVVKGRVKLAISNAPEGTRTIEYQISYDAKDPSALVEGGEGVTPQGVVGKCKESGGRNWECKATDQENIILGTCSSGTCIYHQVIGKVKLELLFRGTYGQRIFNKEYDLSS